MNPIRAFRDVFSSDPVYHAREHARRALRLVEKARELVPADGNEHTVVVSCGNRNGTMTIEGIDFLEALILLARSRQDDASVTAVEERLLRWRDDAR